MPLHRCRHPRNDRARSPVTIAAHAVAGAVMVVYVFVRLVYVPVPKGEGGWETVTLAIYRALRIF